MEFRADNNGKNHLVSVVEVVDGLEIIVTRLNTVSHTYTVRKTVPADSTFSHVMGYVNRISALSNEHFILASQIGSTTE